MKMPVNDQADLSSIVELYIKRDGRSLNQIALDAGLDTSYLWRLKNGQKRRPSRDLLIRLGLVLRMTPGEVDELLLCADYAPITLR
ncbi:MAG: helix-turn-helix transcriptional regulator [Chloroflexota bacterium]